MPRLPRVIAALLGLGPVAATAAPGDPPAYAEVYEKAFAPDFSVQTPAPAHPAGDVLHRVAFRTITIGDLIIKSGRICAADPFVALGEMLPFTQAVPTGNFPVRLAVGDHPAGDVKDSRIAFARVDFTNAPVVRWQMAVNEKQSLAALKANEIYGYGVDAGTGSFYDPAADPAVKALHATNPDAWEAWQTEGEANGPKIVGPYSFVLMLPMGDVNVAMFHSGWGDGFYASYFGYDAAGNVAALVTDFNTIDWDLSKW